MNAASAGLATSLRAETVRCLADGVDTQKIDDFLDRLFEFATAAGAVTCTLLSDRVLRVQAPNQISQDFDLPRIKSKLRMVCARLAVRCGEWGKQKVSPYGDTIELEFPMNRQHYQVRFENTTAAQSLAIESVASHANSNGG